MKVMLDNTNGIMGAGDWLVSHKHLTLYKCKTLIRKIHTHATHFILMQIACASDLKDTT